MEKLRNWQLNQTVFHYNIIVIQKKWVKSVDGLLQICFKIGYVTLIIKLLYKITKIEQYEKIIHVQMIQKSYSY